MNKVTPTALALLLLASTAVEAAAQERQGRGRGERPAASDDGGRRGGGDGQRGGWRGDGGGRRGGDGGQRPQRSEAAPQAQAAQPQQAAPERSGGRAEWRNRQGEGRPNWNRDGGQGRGDRGFRGQRPDVAAPQPAQAVQPNRDWQNRGDRPGMWTRGRPTVEGQRELQRRDGPDRRDWRGDDNRRGDGRRDWDRGNDGRRDWDNRRGNDNRWDGRDNRRWDNNDRYRERPRYDRRNYPSVWRSSQRFRVSIYRPPVGYYSRNWGYGDILPRGWWGPSYYISDWWQYDLPIPPLGYEWVRVGEDAYLIDTYTGRVVQVAYDIFWW